jgi:MerR family mercuric resistance operon transcriptional regulator
MNIENRNARDALLTIGQVSRLAGVNRQTIRYYEREGIIEPPRRKDSGYRIYDSGIVRRIRFIKRAQTLGFTLKEINELLALRNDAPEINCRDVKQYALDKVKSVEKKLADLGRIRVILLELIAVCDEQNSINSCPIMDAFEGDNKNED